MSNSKFEDESFAPKKFSAIVSGKYAKLTHAYSEISILVYLADQYQTADNAVTNLEQL